MAFTDMEDLEPGMEEAGPPPEESSNRTFLLVAGILGGIMVLSLLCIAGYVVFLYPRTQSQRATNAALAIARSTEAAMAVSQTAEVARRTPTFTPPRPTNTTAATITPVVVGPSALGTASPTIDPYTATVAALLTQAAIVTRTPLVTSTGLPTSGFADEVGLPGMVIVAFVLVLIIFLSRRLRTTS
jgi:hypothetical protein